MGWLTGKAIFGLARWVWALLAFAGVLLAVWWLYSTWTANPKAEARLGRNQASAASESGADAVNTVGRAGDREAGDDALTRSNEEDIRNAEGSDATVAPGARDAGLAALCRRRAYADDPRCVRDARTDPR